MVGACSIVTNLRAVKGHCRHEEGRWGSPGHWHAHAAAQAPDLVKSHVRTPLTAQAPLSAGSADRRPRSTPALATGGASSRTWMCEQPLCTGSSHFVCSTSSVVIWLHKGLGVCTLSILLCTLAVLNSITHSCAVDVPRVELEHIVVMECCHGSDLHGKCSTSDHLSTV